MGDDKREVASEPCPDEVRRALIEQALAEAEERILVLETGILAACAWGNVEAGGSTIGARWDGWGSWAQDTYELLQATYEGRPPQSPYPHRDLVQVLAKARDALVRGRLAQIQGRLPRSSK